MVRPVKASPPSPEQETSTPLDDALLGDIESALVERHGHALYDTEQLTLEGTTGPQAARLRFTVGDEDTRYEGELFVRGLADPSLDGALGILVDFLDGLLERWTEGGRAEWLPLEWATYGFEQATVWGRGDVRRPRLEREADLLLGRAGVQSED